MGSRVIGVTGGIGSGKSTVSAILKQSGAGLIDADQIAREIVQKGEQTLIDIVCAFGDDILDECGNLDRKKLSDNVFNDKNKLQKLNEITHTEVARRIIQKIKCETALKVMVLDVPIPIKHGFVDVSDEIWVVVCDLDQRIDRIKRRSGLTQLEAIARLDSQMSEEEYRRFADRIITNNGELESLKKKIPEYFNEFKAKYLIE